MSGTVAIVVVSYARPRMLAECLASIGDCDQVIVADDGSLFDVEAVATRFDLPNLSFVFGPKRSPAERMVTPSCGRLLNAALREVRTDYVLPALCDDDLSAPDFPRAAAAALDADSSLHMVAGRWGLFEDGTEPDPSILLPITFYIPVTAGNWVHRMSCTLTEGCWWNETSQAVHDGPFAWNYMKLHGTQVRGGKVSRTGWLGQLDVLAGYRREHAKTVSNNSLFGGDRYLPRTEAMFATPGGME